MDWLKAVFGEGKEVDINTFQMALRAVITFVITLALVRLSGMRTFGKRTAFDTTIIILLGAILSRVVTGASPFLPTIASATVIALLHRIIAWMSMSSVRLESFVKGQHRLLYKNGEIQWKNMRRSCLSKRDLMESVRLEAKVNSLEDIEEAFIESNGRISVIMKKDRQA